MTFTGANLVPRGERIAGRVILAGKSLVDFTSWDLLGLSSNQRFIESVAGFVVKYGLTSAAARTSTGTAAIHLKSEARVSQFFGAESSLLFSSRSQLVVTLVTLLCDSSTVVFCDERMEAPVVDAAGLVGSQVKLINQNDALAIASEAEAPLIGFASRPKVLFIEGIQPVTGISAPYQKLISAALRANMTVCVDESCSLGLVGLRGAGALDLVSPLPTGLIRFATLDRLTGLSAAVLSGPASLVDTVVKRSRNLTVETAPAPFIARAIIEALDRVELAAVARERLKLSAAHVHSKLTGINLDVTSQGETPFLCFSLKSGAQSEEFVLGLREQGLLLDRQLSFQGGKEVVTFRGLINSHHAKQDLELLISGLWELSRRVPRGIE